MWEEQKDKCLHNTITHTRTHTHEVSWVGFPTTSNVSWTCVERGCFISVASLLRYVWSHDNACYFSIFFFTFAPSHFGRSLVKWGTDVYACKSWKQKNCIETVSLTCKQKELLESSFQATQEGASSFMSSIQPWHRRSCCLSSVQLLSPLSQPDRLVQRDQETSLIALRRKFRKVQKVQVSNLVRLGRRVRSFKTSGQLYKRSKETQAVSCLQFNPDNTLLWLR